MIAFRTWLLLAGALRTRTCHYRSSRSALLIPNYSSLWVRRSSCKTSGRGVTMCGTTWAAEEALQLCTRAMARLGRRPTRRLHCLLLSTSQLVPVRTRQQCRYPPSTTMTQPMTTPLACLNFRRGRNSRLHLLALTHNLWMMTTISWETSQSQWLGHLLSQQHPLLEHPVRSRSPPQTTRRIEPWQSWSIWGSLRTKQNRPWKPQIRD